MKKSLVWFRRDLRLHDHHALSYATENSDLVYGVFVFDEHILNKLPSKNDQRLTFIIDSLKEMETKLNKIGSSLYILFGKPETEIPKLAQALKIDTIYTNRDYEPYAKKRDELVKKNFPSLVTFKDHVQFEKQEVLTGSRTIFKVFTPYKNQWLKIFDEQGGEVNHFPVHLKKFAPFKNKDSILNIDWHTKLGFVETPPALPAGTTEGLKRLKKFKAHLKNYKTTRDFPVLDGTSSLSVYIRHGNISIRDMLSLARSENNEGAKTWLSELIWRDFYHVILDAHPFVEKNSFKKEYDQIKWLGTEADFKAWCEGQTGVPIVDAAMRCLNQTGLMHNRLRMVVASYLCKILLVDWRKGEKYFAEKLLDFDLAANNGGWQWSSSTGCDAQPYFRIFNPYTQSEKFDSDGRYIKQWCPELKHLDSKQIHRPDPKIYAPIRVYEDQRMKALRMYDVIKKSDT